MTFFIFLVSLFTASSHVRFNCSISCFYNSIVYTGLCRFDSMCPPCFHRHWFWAYLVQLAVLTSIFKVIEPGCILNRIPSDFSKSICETHALGVHLFLVSWSYGLSNILLSQLNFNLEIFTSLMAASNASHHSTRSYINTERWKITIYKPFCVSTQ